MECRCYGTELVVVLVDDRLVDDICGGRRVVLREYLIVKERAIWFERPRGCRFGSHLLAARQDLQIDTR